MDRTSFVPVGVAVLTVSDTRTLETDTSGALVVDTLENLGHRIVDRAIVSDQEEDIRSVLSRFIASGDVQVVITTGGTGITARDVTPEAIAPLVTKRIEGFGELFRMLSYADIGASTVQSRAVGAICDKTLVFALPGSTGAVRLALDKILVPQLDIRTNPCNFVMLFDRL